jgi:CTP synthase
MAHKVSLGVHFVCEAICRGCGMSKYIFVSGGVISGIGKGITTASLGALLKAAGYTVSPMKIDMYFNMDAGTLRPQEHGEVFVTNDGLETDQDLGNYERFLDIDLTAENYLTNGMLYDTVLRKERAFEYEGITVQPIPHITNEIQARVKAAGRSLKADIVLVELGGTVGDYENMLFFEASRILKLRSPHDVLQVHLGYLPIPDTLGEMKSKPIQQSVRALNSLGVQPDMIVGRSTQYIDKKRREKISLFTNVQPEDVISNPDVHSIYQVPLILDEQNVGQRILEKFNLPVKQHDMTPWLILNEQIVSAKRPIKIGLIGKYFATGDFVLEDVYVSVIEALKHAAWDQGYKPELFWVDAEKVEKQGVAKLAEMDGIVVPGGFGSRGIEGMVEAVRFAREARMPYFGLCYGMQMATIEYARNVVGLAGANTTEVDEHSPYPVVHIMPDQAKKLLDREYGATMRLGSWKCKLVDGSLARHAYGKSVIVERHRHRYEFNNEFGRELQQHGLRITGTSPDGQLVEIIELDERDHPFFVGVQFHPEFLSRPSRPHPLFREFIKASSARLKP